MGWKCSFEPARLNRGAWSTHFSSEELSVILRICPLFRTRFQKRPAKKRLDRRYTGSLSDIFYDTFVAGYCSHSVLHHWFTCYGVLGYCAVHGRAMVYLDLFARRAHP